MVTRTCALVEQLQVIPDPRRQCRNLKHRLVDVLLIGFCGMKRSPSDVDELMHDLRELSGDADREANARLKQRIRNGEIEVVWGALPLRRQVEGASNVIYA
jgi:hypothetical protein